jgi:hypothetical protein
VRKEEQKSFAMPEPTEAMTNQWLAMFQPPVKLN